MINDHGIVNISPLRKPILCLHGNCRFSHLRCEPHFNLYHSNKYAFLTTIRLHLLPKLLDLTRLCTGLWYRVYFRYRIHFEHLLFSKRSNGNRRVKVFTNILPWYKYSKIPMLRPPLRLSKSGLKDHFWTVPKVVSNQKYTGCRKWRKE